MFRVVCAASLLAGVSSTAFAQQARTAVEPEIVVTASPLGGSPDRFATIVDTVDRDQILKAGGANLADAIADVPGVSSTSFAAGASRPVIRGMDANRVKILEDGLDASDVSEVGPDHGVPIDPLSAQRIEVVRGAATLRYGSQAIGGAINAINNRVPLSLPARSFSGEASQSYAGNAKTGEGAGLVDGRIGQFALHADGFLRHSSNYDTPLGEQANSFLRGDGFSAGSSYFFGDGDKSHIGAALLHYDTKYGIPSDTTFIDMRQTKALSKSSFAFADGPLQTINVDLSYADYLHDEKDPGGAVLSTFKSKEGDGRVEALFGQMGFVSAAALGLQAQNRRFSALGEAGDFLSPTLTQSEAAFAFAEAPLGARANVQAAARVERVDVKGTPASGAPAKRNFTPVSGSLGALFDITEALKLGLTISSAARAPGQVELFAHGPHDGPGTFETGDPDLKIERSNSIEATLRVRRQRLHVDGSVWAAQFDNYVFGNLTGRTCDDTGACVPDDSQELKELFYAQADARFWGAEGKATLNVIENEAGALNANLLADYVRAKFTHGGGDVPRIQPYRVGGGLSWTSEAFDAGFLLIYVGKQDKVPVGDTVTKGYVSLDAQAAWRPLANNDRFEIALSGRNLTDDVQRNAVALNRDLVVLPGRDVRLVLRERF